MLTQQKISRHLASFPVREDIIVDIISGPTAVGKSWVVDRLKRTHQYVVPTTSRPRRQDEVNGVDYYFVTRTEYEKAILKGEMATTFILDKYYYGYSGKEFEKISNNNKKPLVIIYYKVLDPFLEKFPNSQIYFMFPPYTEKGLELLKRRMMSRTVVNFDARWRDTLEQMYEMYVAKPNLLARYPNSKLYTIEDDRSALKLIKDLEKNAIKAY